jgi:meiotic recombination protein REC8, fungi type
MEGLTFHNHNERTADSYSGLDTASQQFLNYIVDQMGGESASAAAKSITFEDIANPSVHSHAVAAQAFLHVLSLATKGIVSVQQTGSEMHMPYGDIHIHITKSTTFETSVAQGE